MTRTSEFLKHHRLKQKLTQRHIAKKLKIHVQNVSNWEGGMSQIPPKHLVKLSEILDVSVDEFISKLTQDFTEDLKDNL